MSNQSLTTVLESTRQFKQPENLEEVHGLVALIRPQLKLIANDLSLRDEQGFTQACQEVFKEFSGESSPFSFSNNGVNVVHPYLRLELMEALSNSSVCPERLKGLNDYLLGNDVPPARRRRIKP